MNPEKIKHLAERAAQIGLPLGLLAISLWGVSFPESNRGFAIQDEADVAKLSAPEQAVATKLLQLGLKPTHEKKQIKLDDGVRTGKNIRHTEIQKTKSVTTPDFFVRINHIDCFIEVGSYRQNTHKRQQEQVAREAVTFKGGRKMVYVQLFHDDIEYVVANIQTAEELLEYLYQNPTAVFA